MDQSGRIEDLTSDTVLALANDIRYSIVIPAAAKRSGSAHLRNKGLSKQATHLRLFAVGLYLLLKDHLDDFDRAILDVEFVGHEATIKGMLLRQIQKVAPMFDQERLTFQRIGKKSPAHRLAWGGYRKRLRPDKVISRREFISALK